MHDAVASWHVCLNIIIQPAQLFPSIRKNVSLMTCLASSTSSARGHRGHTRSRS